MSRTPGSAVNAAILPIQRAASTILQQPIAVISRQTFQSGTRVMVAFDVSPVRVETRFGPLWIVAEQILEIVRTNERRPAFQALNCGYIYSINEDVNRSREILVYHWDRDAASPRRNYPHLHIGATIQNDTCADKHLSFSRLHVRTNHIAAHTFVLMLLEEFGVPPRRATWRSTLLAEEATIHP